MSNYNEMNMKNKTCRSSEKLPCTFRNKLKKTSLLKHLVGAKAQIRVGLE